MQKGFAALAAFLLVMGWQYRKNRPVLFVIVATLFAEAALFVARRTGPWEWILKSLAFCWLICMLAAGVFAVEKLIYSKRVRKSYSKGIEAGAADVTDTHIAGSGGE
jgi:hypothetical protein